MKNPLKFLFMILLTLLVINNTYKIHKRPEVYINKDIIEKVNALDYKPIHLIDSSVTVHNIKSKGSGSIIKIDKNSTYILTAAHVIYEQKIIRNINGKLEKINKLSKNITVKSKNKKYKAIIIKIDKELDIAVIKIFKKLKIEPVKIAKKEPEFGEIVWAIASPGEHSNILNKGIFSGIKKNYSFVSTANYFGSSGGMVVNTKGEQIGTISAIVTTTINRFFPNITVFNAITRTKDLNKFLKGIL